MWHYTPASHQNISVNYYQVTSATAVRDSTTEHQMTVMTTRTQGGTVLEHDCVELMQKRRLNYNDEYSKGMVLIEGDAVQATNFVQLFDRAYKRSEQYLDQIRYDNSLQYFFAFDFKINAWLSNHSRSRAQLHEAPGVRPAEGGVPPIQPLTGLLHGVEPGRLLRPAREEGSSSRHHAFAETVFERVNGRNMSANDYCWFTELSLSRNKGLNFMRSEKVSLVSEDDDFLKLYKFPKDKF